MRCLIKIINSNTTEGRSVLSVSKWCNLEPFVGLISRSSEGAVAQEPRMDGGSAGDNSGDASVSGMMTFLAGEDTRWGEGAETRVLPCTHPGWPLRPGH